MDGVHCAFIGADNASGYNCSGNTAGECIKDVKNYLDVNADDLFEEE